MHWQTRIRAKRRNERIRLVVNFLNVTAIGTFGLAVTAPIVGQLSFKKLAAGPEIGGKLTIFTQNQDASLSDVVLWDVAVGALAAHVCAHLLTVLLEPED